MKIAFSYTPAAEDRKLEIRSSAVSRMRFLWLPGALLTVAGVGVLAKLAASAEASLLSGGAAFAAWTGVLLVAVPNWSAARAVERELSQRPFEEREVVLSESGIRTSVPGITAEVAWSKVCAISESATHWSVTFDAARTLQLPKRAVSEAQASQISRLLERAKG